MRNEVFYVDLKKDNGWGIGVIMGQQFFLVMELLRKVFMLNNGWFLYEGPLMHPIAGLFTRLSLFQAFFSIYPCYTFT